MNQTISEKWIKQEIIRFVRELQQRQFTCLYDGNISFRLRENEFLITKADQV